MVTHEEFVQANERAKELQSRVPRAVSARYDRHTRRVMVRLSSNLGIFFSPRDAEGLEHATAKELMHIEISPSGYGLHFPMLNADLYVPSLLEGVFGSERWVAARSGANQSSSNAANKRRYAKQNVEHELLQSQQA